MNPTPATVATPGYLAGTWKAGSGTPGVAGPHADAPATAMAALATSRKTTRPSMTVRSPGPAA
jgi:hypothetical protein